MDNKHSKISEEISSLMDGEFDPASKHNKRMLDEICGCDDSKQQWERFHLLRDLLIEEKGVVAVSELSVKISSAIDKEPHRIGSTRWLKRSHAPSSFWKQMVGMGVAASVTAVIVTGIHSVDPFLPEANVATQFTSQYSPTFQSVIPASARVERFNQTQALEIPSLDERKRIERLFLEHTLSASENGLKGLLPYAKVVSYSRIPTQVTKVDAVTSKPASENQKDTENRQKP